MRARIVDEIADGIDLLAHSVGHHGDLAACAKFPNAPSHRVERGRTNKPHLERARDALRRRHGDAHAGKRTRTAPNAHARDVPARDPSFGEQRIDTGGELGVRLAARLDFNMCDKLDRARFLVKHAHADGNHLVGSVEGEHVGGFVTGRIDAKRSRCWRFRFAHSMQCFRFRGRIVRAHDSAPRASVQLR